MPEQSKPKPTSGYKRKYPVLSPEDRNAVLDDLKEHMKLEKLLKEKPASPKGLSKGDNATGGRSEYV